MERGHKDLLCYPLLEAQVGRNFECQFALHLPACLSELLSEPLAWRLHLGNFPCSEEEPGGYPEYRINFTR